MSQQGEDEEGPPGGREAGREDPGSALSYLGAHSIAPGSWPAVAFWALLRCRASWPGSRAGQVMVGAPSIL